MLASILHWQCRKGLGRLEGLVGEGRLVEAVGVCGEVEGLLVGCTRPLDGTRVVDDLKVCRSDLYA